MAHTEARDRGQIVDPNGAGKVLLDEFDDTPGLPWRKMPVEAGSSCSSIVCFAALDLGLENVGGLGNELPGCFIVSIERLLGRVEKLHQYGGQ